MRNIFTLLLIIGISIKIYSQNFTDFESQPKGTAYTAAHWQSDGFIPGSFNEGLETRTMIDDSVAKSGKKSLRISYPKDHFGTEQTGCQIPLQFTPANQMYMSYWIMFSENFSWGSKNEGGKLPGLAGGKRCSGGETCDGTNGFTARFMWRSDGKIVLYLYHMDKPSKYGEDIDLVYPSGEKVVFKKGTWYQLMERVKINSSPPSHDGEVEVWVNGQVVLLKSNLRFTTNGDKVDNLYISTFHGGHDAEWSPTTTCYTWIDDLHISPNKKDVESKQ